MKAQDILDAYPGNPPEPTADNPFVQVKWVFAQQASKVPSVGAKENYAASLKHVTSFLEQTRGREPLALDQLWGVTVLIEFKNWLLSPDCDLGSFSRTTVNSCFRSVLREAVRLDLIPGFANATLPSGTRETQLHNVYSERELQMVLDVVRREHAFSKQVMGGYTPTGVGIDPRIRPPAGQKGAAGAAYGWKPEANMRWYFENEMKCVPVGWKSAGPHGNFLQSAGTYHGGMKKLYRSWGVTVTVDEHVIAPQVIQLQYLTGLNPYSLITLGADCLREHPLLKTQYLRYRKLRSGGDKQLLLDLLNGVRSTLDIGDFVDHRIDINREQAVLIERCIVRILKLTEGIRGRATDDLKGLLFIYESSGVKTHGEVMHFDLQKVNAWCHKIVDREQLTADDGTRLSFNLVRFRPTRLTEMARQGKDFFEIQQVAGHQNVKTTVGYIEERMLGLISDKTVVKAMDTIWSNKDEFEARQRTVPGDGADIIKIEAFETLMCRCKNVFDPPEHVRREASYVEGEGCTKFNMCLFCDNIIVTSRDLPYLAYYRAQVRRALSPESKTDVPHRKLYERTLSVLDQIFDPDESEFSCEQIDAALELSLDVDLVIDWLVYVATEEV